MVQWNHFNPITVFIATDDGMLRHVDMRKPGESIREGQAHEGSIGGLSLSAVTRGLLTTAGHDEMLHVWKAKDDGSLDRVLAEKLALGALHALQFNPDVSTICCTGGSADDLIRVVDLAKSEPVVIAFS